MVATKCGWLIVASFIVTTIAVGSVDSQFAKGADKGWKTFTSMKGRFSIDIPPGSETQEMLGSLRIKLKRAKYSYLLYWTTVDADVLKDKTADQFLDWRRDELVKKLRDPLKSELVSEKAITAGTHVGREIVIRKTGIKMEFGIVIPDIFILSRERLFLVGDVEYRLSAYGEPEFASSTDTTRWLESFAFTEDRPASAPKEVPPRKAGIDRTWTNRDGRQVDAAFLELTNGGVKIRRKADGAIFTILLDNLSDADRDWLTTQP